MTSAAGARLQGLGGDLSSWEGEPAQVLRDLWDVPYLELHSTIGSTNDRARELARSGAPDRTLVIAEEQTAGRGREGRPWRSLPGQGLWMSMVAPPRPADVPVPDPLPLLTGLAVSEAIEMVCAGLEILIKWPNDLIVSDRKCGGILCERESGRPVLGIGVNVLPLPGEVQEELPFAGALSDVSTAPVSRVSLVTGVTGALGRAGITRTGVGRPDPLERGLVDRDWLHGRIIAIVSGDRRLEGRAAGIDPDGALRIETSPGRLERVWAGTVTLAEDPPTTGPPRT